MVEKGKGLGVGEAGKVDGVLGMGLVQENWGRGRKGNRFESRGG